MAYPSDPVETRGTPTEVSVTWEIVQVQFWSSRQADHHISHRELKELLELGYEPIAVVSDGYFDCSWVWLRRQRSLAETISANVIEALGE